MATITGGTGNDTLLGTDGNDSIYGGAGNDTVTGGSGNDLIYLGAGDDAVDDWYNNGGKDTIYGEAGNDTIVGGSEDDVLYGGDGNDALSGGEGHDSLYGGTGNDRGFVTEDHGFDYFELGDEGADVDTLQFFNWTSQDGVSVTFTGNDAGTYSYSNSGATGQFIGVEQMLATDYNDTINAAADTDGAALLTYGGADSIVAGSGADYVDAGVGDDTVMGGAGNDTIFGGDGNDLLHGEVGDERILGGAGDDSLYGGAGRDTLTAGAGNDLVDGGADCDILYIASGEGSDTIDGGTGGIDDDSLFFDPNWTGSSGVTVTFTGNEAGSYAYGSTGNGTFSDIERLEGTASSDKIDASATTIGTRFNAGNGNDTFIGGSGDDFVEGGIANDSLSGGAGNDMLYGGYNDDSLFGGAGNDSIYGGAGGDLLYGGDGNDSIIGGAGADTMYGGKGNDWFSVTDDHDSNVIFGGEDVLGTDYDGLSLTNYVTAQGVTVTYSNAEAGHIQFEGTANTVNFAEIERVDGTSNADTFDAAAATKGIDAAGLGGDDTMKGGSGEDGLDGGSGNDLLYGGAGSDRLTGGDGNDTMIGGSGNDTLVSGAGADLFVFGGGGGEDQVNDFDMTLVAGKTTDQLDVTDLTNPDGTPIRWADIKVTATEFGDTVLSFPEGETITLGGIPPAIVTKQMAARMGVPCFANGTLIDTPKGRRRIEDLRAGDLVTTHRGPQPVIWIGGRQIGQEELATRPDLQPVVIRRGALRNDLPLILSRQHSVAILGRSGPVLVRAAQLAQLGRSAFRQAKRRQNIVYHHILLPEHALLRANGAWAESLWPGSVGIAALGHIAEAEISAALPRLGIAMKVPRLLQPLYGPQALKAVTTQVLRELADISPVNDALEFAAPDVAIEGGHRNTVSASTLPAEQAHNAWSE